MFIFGKETAKCPMSIPLHNKKLKFFDMSKTNKKLPCSPKEWGEK